jgi:hypothetical protein
MPQEVKVQVERGSMTIVSTQLAESRARCAALELELKELQDAHEAATVEAEEQEEGHWQEWETSLRLNQNLTVKIQELQGEIQVSCKTSTRELADHLKSLKRESNAMGARAEDSNATRFFLHCIDSMGGV